MRTIAHLVAGGLAATALVAGSAVSATAQSEKIADKRADVVHIFDLFSDPEDPGTVLDREASIATGIDATSATIKHGKKSLKVTIKFAKLTKESFILQSSVRVKGAKQSPKYGITNDGMKKSIYVYSASTDKKLCSAKMKRKTGNKGSISFTIKRSCLGNPKSVKLQTGLFAFPDGFENEDTLAVNVESISPKKLRTPAWTKWLKSS